MTAKGKRRNVDINGIADRLVAGNAFTVT